jgi:hypothetical protein
MTTPQPPTEGQNPIIRDRKGGPIFTTRGLWSRAVGLFDEVCRRARSDAFLVAVPREGHQRGTFLAKDGHLVEVYVRETDHEQVVDRRRVLVPTGRLAFHIGHVYLASGGGFGSREIVWRDGRRLKLEDRIDEIIAGIQKQYAFLVEWDRRAAAEEQVAAEKARRARERREQQEAEDARFNELVRQVTSWELSRRIRAFADDAERSLLKVHGQIETGSEVAEWLQWARKRAELADPLRRIR